MELRQRVDALERAHDNAVYEIKVRCLPLYPPFFCLDTPLVKWCGYVSWRA
jgi:hypothetical protein